ncbi:Carnitine O-acetyltransferase mitochondrial, partial [Spiromyces aspiralis]
MDNSSPQPLAVAYSSAQLPRLPIPNLGDTVNKYLDTVRPLVSEREFEETRRKALAFAAAGGPGEVLQARLKARAEKAAAEPAHSPSSCWLAQWWNDYAYFENRESICFNVNYFFGFQKHPQGHPQTQADVAAILVHKALQVRQVVESGRYPQVTMRGKPLCMTQFQYMFGTCRHPGDGKDQTEKYDEPLSRHIAIAHRGRFYVLNAFDKDGQLLDLETIKCYINLVLKGGYSGSDMPSIGVLTTTPRQQWYHAREALIRVSSTNAKNLRRLESAAFLLSLEDSEPQTRHEMSRACWHGNGQNRYFDKNLQLLVFANGRYGFNGEHSMTDATTDLELCNRLVEAVESATAPIAAPAHVPGNPSEALTLLEFDYNSDLLTAIKRANDYFSVTVASHEYFAGKCDSFGKEAIKKLNVSPDAFIQMA